jgi:hypothetical protein
VTAVEIRLATDDDIPTCAEIWRESINDYTGRLNQPPIPDDLGRIIRLHRHLFSTDPERFVVALAGERIVGFAAAAMRDRLWYLSMCFVRPGQQGAGLGRRLVEATLPEAPDAILATATDSAQPISTGLYSRFGIVPRMPLLSMAGYITNPETLADLPSGIVALPFEEIVADFPDGTGHRAVSEAVGALDLELLGVEHPQDHRFLRMEGRHGYLYRDASGLVQGYGYAWETGRVGPVAIRDEALMRPVLGHLLRVVESRGAQAVWVPGAAGTAVETLLRAGLRFEDFPLLLGWTQPFAQFERYLPISPGLL